MNLLSLPSVTQSILTVAGTMRELRSLQTSPVSEIIRIPALPPTPRGTM